MGFASLYPSYKKVLLALPHRVHAPRSAAGAGQEQAGEAEHDGEAAVVDYRKEPARKMPEEIGEGHFAGQHERDTAGEQSEDQQPAENQLDAAGGAVQRHQLDFREHRHRRKFQQLGDAILKQHQSGDDAEDAEHHRLESCEHAIKFFHDTSPQARFMEASTLHGPAPAVDRYRQVKQYMIARLPLVSTG